MALLRDSFALDTQMANVYELGKALIKSTPTATAAYVAIQQAFAQNAAQGEKKFTVNVAHNADNASLELKGLYWNTYKSGLLQALAEEHIYNYEVTAEMNFSQRSIISIDLKFSF